MRTKQSVKNIIASFLNYFVLSILRFVSRTIFIKLLGELYLGVNGLLTNVLGILSLAELGLSTAISFALYKPLSENNKEKIKSYMAFYKKTYLIISLVVLVAGLILLPFLNFFISDKSVIVDNLYLSYLIFLGNMVVSYLFSYKITLITADQREYHITIIHMITSIVTTLLQILSLYLFKNYTIYLVIGVITNIIQYLYISYYVNKMYPYLKDKNVKALTKEENTKIKVDIKSLLAHKIGSYFVDSTDNIIISKYLGLTVVGLYSNYYLLISMISKFITSIFSSLSSSIGNLYVESTTQKKYEVYKTYNFIGFSLFFISTICFLNLFNPFIETIWLDSKYVFSFSSVIIICLNYYTNGVMHTNDVINSSAGLYTKDKYIPLIQSIINIIFSIILVKYYGLSGVFMGTIISCILPTIVKPIIIYNNIFKMSSKIYFINYFKQILLLIIGSAITVYLTSIINISNPYINIIVYLLISLIIPLLIIFIVYNKTSEYKDAFERVRKIIRRNK